MALVRQGKLEQLAHLGIVLDDEDGAGAVIRCGGKIVDVGSGLHGTRCQSAGGERDFDSEN